MKVYYDFVSEGFYQSDIHRKIPKDSVEVTDELRWSLINGQSDEYFIVKGIDGLPTLNKRINDFTQDIKSERSWRDAELTRVDVELYKVQDSDPKAVGTVTEWRSYRKALRSWPEDVNFPDRLTRPHSPDAKD